MFDRSTRLFLRYRDRGDTSALAAVFDRTAPELLRLALHLCRRLDDAEDLLQATFLAAIESAPRFDRSKKVMPWLTGILVNRARTGRRELRRAGDESGDLDAVAGPPLDPGELAADRELSQSARDALEELAEPFRQPMLLRFVHGMEPAEIALLLKRSPGTVRGQLHRGLERLRGSVPTAIATALAATSLATGRGLAAVRTAVLCEGASSCAAAAAGTTATLALTIAMTKKILFTSLAVACSIAIGWLAWPDAPRPPAPDVARENVVLEGADTASMATALGGKEAPPAPTVDPTSRTVAPLPESAATWPVAVVVVDGTTGEPLVDAAVALHGPRSMTLLDLQRAFADVAPVGSTGIPNGGPELRALRNLPVEVLAGGKACDLLVPPADDAEPLLRATTNNAGRCDLQAPATGAFLVVRCAGFGKGQRLLDEAPTDDLKVTLWPARYFSGVVRTAENEVPAAPLRLALHGDQQVWFVDTDEQGGFRAEVTADFLEVRCVTPGWSTSRHYRKPNSELKWIGSRQFRVGADAEVYVAPYSATQLHVTDATTGKPIEVFGVIASDDNGYPKRCGQFVAPGGWLALETASEVQFVLDQPEMASYRAMRAATLIVFAESHQPVVLHDVPLLGEDSKTIEVALPRGEVGAFAGKVTRGSEPVANARVQLRPLPRFQWDSGDSMVIATQKCAEQGEFSLIAPPGDYVCEVFVDGKCELQQQIVLPTAGPVSLDLAASVFVDVLVVDPRGVPVADHNAVVQAGVGQRGVGRTGSDGHVVFGPFPAGQLHAQAPREATKGSWISGVEVEFTAEAGTKPTITLRLPPNERVRPVLMFDGPGPVDGFAGFTATASFGGDAKPVPVGESGAVPIELVPGEGRLRVEAPGGRRWSFKIPSDAPEGHVLPLRWQGLAYAGTAVNELGQPIANTRLDAYPMQPGPQVSVQTAIDGTFRLDGLEPCRYRLSIAVRPPRSQDRLFPRQQWLPLAPPATEPQQLRLQLYRADNDVLRGLEEFAVVGRLVNASGAPIPEAIASVSTVIEQEGGVLEIWPRPAWRHTNADGTFRMMIVRGTRYRAQFSAKLGAPPIKQQVVLPKDQDEVHHEFVLR